MKALLFGSIAFACALSTVAMEKETSEPKPLMTALEPLKFYVNQMTGLIEDAEGSHLIQTFRSAVGDVNAKGNSSVNSGGEVSSIRFHGPFARGLFASEHGIHRLVRLSPTNNSGRRHTSFAAVSVSGVPDSSCLPGNSSRYSLSHTAQLREVEIFSPSRLRNSFAGTFSGKINSPCAFNIAGKMMQ